jgi:hypothetical protein
MRVYVFSYLDFQSINQICEGIVYNPGKVEFYQLLLPALSLFNNLDTLAICIALHDNNEQLC